MLGDFSFKKIIKCLVQYSKTLDPRYNIIFQEARATSAARDLVSCRVAQGAVESSCGRYVHVTQVLRRFPAASRLVEKINDEAASSDSTTAGDYLDATHVGNAVRSCVEEQNVLLHIETAAAHTRGQKQTPASNERVFYKYAAFF